MHSDLVRAALIIASAKILTQLPTEGNEEVKTKAARYLLTQYNLVEGRVPISTMVPPPKRENK